MALAFPMISGQMHAPSISIPRRMPTSRSCSPVRELLGAPHKSEQSNKQSALALLIQQSEGWVGGWVGGKQNSCATLASIDNDNYLPRDLSIVALRSTCGCCNGDHSNPERSSFLNVPRCSSPWLVVSTVRTD
jgi:hypothetical protein